MRQQEFTHRSNIKLGRYEKVLQRKQIIYN